MLRNIFYLRQYHALFLSELDLLYANWQLDVQTVLVEKICYDMQG